MTVSKNRNS